MFNDLILSMAIQYVDLFVKNKKRNHESNSRSGMTDYNIAKLPCMDSFSNLGKFLMDMTSINVSKYIRYDDLASIT